MRRIFDRLPLTWKYILMSVLIFLVFYFSFSLFTARIISVIDTLQLNIPTSVIQSQIQNQFIWFFIWGALVSIFLLMLMYFDLKYFLNRINHHFKYAIARKKMIPNLEEFKSKDLFQDITENANQMFSLFKNFDQMKSSRIFLEVTSIKALINVISEGVIFVNQDKVVTHINHQAEEILRLIPGEVIGEIISRHIINDVLLTNLDQVLVNDQRITDIKVNLRDKEELVVTILPIKNKYGELIRVVIIFFRSSDSDS